MNLLLRPIFEPTAEQSLIRYRQRRRLGFDTNTDDEEILVVILAIEEGKRR